ncbi:hypothetical protein DOO78_06810 [Roseicella frigidaeris]|uniref:Uncharacterized protein n=1 Tax=Roseicella frigidaeris TaxID=2230885 RepID=A0A327MC00_9PROT|nr:hypothetical protein DOO78_06810 [Roseicella frigidaeris]
MRRMGGVGVGFGQIPRGWGGGGRDGFGQSPCRRVWHQRGCRDRGGGCGVRTNPRRGAVGVG